MWTLKTPAALWALLLALAAPALARQTGQSQPKSEAAPQSYPDSTGGLTSLVNDILDAMQRKDSKSLGTLLSSLVLPDSHAWFASVFGDDLGAHFAGEYAKMSDTLPFVLSRDFGVMLDEGFTGAKAIRFKDSCGEASNPYEYPVLAARQKPEPLYEVRLNKHGGEGRAMWFFAYVDGGFRYIGHPQVPPLSFPPLPAAAIASKSAASAASPTVERAKLLHRVVPGYPMEAKESKWEGTVILGAIIGKDGRVESLRVIEGYCEFAQSAIRAVKKWRYAPTTLNGQPVDVATKIRVFFTLKH